MTLETLCSRLELPSEVQERVLSCAPPESEELLAALTAPETAETACEKLRTLTGGDGFVELSWQLRAALLTWRRYEELGIGEDIFFDTMDCFPRFVKEHMASYGVYGFDRGWWTWRQLSLCLFCLGSLEYELKPGGRVSLHIPSGADLSPEACRASLDSYRALVSSVFPRWKNADLELRSWLLSPALRELLPPESRILRFQKCFEIRSWDQINGEFQQWVYGRSGIPPEELPEDTTLRRRMKAYLLGGGRVGSGWGVLRSFTPSR